MVVFALETVTRAGSLALSRGTEVTAVAGDASRPHGERLPGEAVEWLSARGHALNDLDRFAVVIGPGSFTGIRVGMATVQGWALALGRPVVPVSTFEAVAAGWRHAGGAAVAECVAVCVDGQRGEIFGALLPARGEPAGTDPLVGPPGLVGAALRTRAGTRTIALAGDGAVRHADALRAALTPVQTFDDPLPMAAAVARIASSAGESGVRPHALRPLYVRRPDVELARERAAQARPAAPAGAGNLVVRRASGQDDLTAVEALQGRTFTNPWGAEAIRWELERTDVARLYLLSAVDGTLVGYCACWVVFDELHINSLAVDPSWRRRGAASRLLTAVFADAVEAGARSATLEVRASNDAALKLYEGLGFRVEGVRRDYYQSPREDALILWNRSLAGVVRGRTA